MLPRCRRALAGFLKDDPPKSEDPCPLEAAAVIGEWLLTRKMLLPKLAGLAFLSSYDLFTRPSEILNAKADDVVVPAVGRYKDTSLVVAPSTATRGSEEPRRPAKSGEFDDTVIAGLKGLRLEFVAEILKHLKKQTHGQDNLFWPLELGAYERLMQKAVTALDLGALHITPHSARHCGASSASLLKLLKIKEIQRRGRWLAPKSVRRYEKAGKLTRQVSLMAKQLVCRGERLLLGELRDLALEASKSVAKLRRAELAK